jgi:hypothetical protein
VAVLAVRDFTQVGMLRGIGRRPANEGSIVSTG